MVRGRFAPTPSGWLHLGNARTALAAWLRARAQGGSFVVRVEDLDGPRTIPEAVAGNLEELRWLGLDWDEGPDIGGSRGPYLQSAREDRYLAALAQLQDSGQVFACYLSRKELREIGVAPHGQTPVYGARERALNALLTPEKVSQGKPPSLRLRAPETTIRFDDAFAGPQEASTLDDVGDIVIRRADGLWSYQLAVVVDDIAMGITEVVRGDDLLPNTFAQLLLYQALSAAPPTFVHIPLLLAEDGTRLAKRNGPLTLHALKAQGIESQRVVGLLAATLGLTDSPLATTPRQLLERFELDKLDRLAATLTATQLAWLLA